MSSATDLSDALSAAQSAAVVLISEAAADKQALVGAVSDLNLAHQTIAERDVTIVQLRDRIAELEAGTEPTPTAKPMLGTSASKWAHPGPFDYMRCYDGSQVDGVVRDHEAKRVGLSFKDDPRDPAVVVSRLKAIVAKHPDLLIDYAENELDRHAVGAAAISKWVSDTKKIQAAVHAAFPTGNVLVGGDWTRQLVVEDFFVEMARQGLAPDFAGFSLYPEGRKKSPPVESPLTDHIDPSLNLAAKYGVKRVIVWEIGTPVSTRYDRPTVVAKWAPHALQVAQTNGQELVAVAYWDGWLGGPGDIDNRFQNDAPKTQQAFLASLG